jgi:hypothetical protein
MLLSGEKAASGSGFQEGFLDALCSIFNTKVGFGWPPKTDRIEGMNG